MASQDFSNASIDAIPVRELYIVSNIKPLQGCQKIWFSLCVMGAIISVAISMHLPVSLYATAGHDDALFITNAFKILTGNWLGNFSQMTLAKGPGYSIFLAINTLLGIPVTLSISVFYVFACWVFTRALESTGLKTIFASSIFLILIFEPALLTTRIIRDNIYPSLLLLAITGLIFTGNTGNARRGNLVIAFFGLCLGFLWITREEGIWIAPGISSYIIYKAIKLKNSNNNFASFLRQFAIYTISAISVPLAISSINYYKYGTFEVVDFKGTSFETALRRMNNVSVGPEIPYVPVPRAKRDQIYKVSPAFRQLESYFEDTGKGWTQPGCATYPHTCGDYAGGWFMWALRDGAASKGYYDTPQKAKAFYDQISSDIENACKKGVLVCSSTILPFLPVIPDQNLKQIPQALEKAMLLSFYRITVPLTDGDSLGPVESIRKMRIFLGNPKTTLSAEEQILTIEGWYHSTSKDWIKLECRSEGTPVTTTIERRDSPDVVAYFHDESAKLQRISLKLRKNDHCAITPINQIGPSVSVENLIKGAGSSISLGDGIFFIEKGTAEDVVYVRQLRIKQWISELYGLLSPSLIIIGILCFTYSLVVFMIKKQVPNELFWIAGILWLLYITRMILIILIDITAFPAINYLYAAPAFPVVHAASILSISLVFSKK